MTRWWRESRLYSIEEQVTTTTEGIESIEIRNIKEKHVRQSEGRPSLPALPAS
jgi:hypothetical protein